LHLIQAFNRLTIPKATSIMTNTTRTVLIIEDNLDIADSLAQVLRFGYGFEVTTAADGLAGLKMATENHPDAVVCDIGLPRRNGLLVGEELAGMSSHKPLLIAVSGYAEQMGNGVALEVGFDHFLAKPADPLVIGDLIEAYTPPTIQGSA
jgi:two-component system, sensor histidine kinase